MLGIRRSGSYRNCEDLDNRKADDKDHANGLDR